MDLKSFGLVLTLFLAVYAHSSFRAKPAAPPGFDCAARKLAYKFALKQQGWRGNLKSVFDALELHTLCGVPDIKDIQTPSRAFGSSKAETKFFVSPKGSDSNPGTLDSPFKTIKHAVDKAGSTSGAVEIFLREGIYYLQETLSLSPSNSDISFTSYNGEKAEINGGIPLDLTWKPYKVDKSMNIYVADVSSYNIATMPGLRVNGRRAIRARFPNANPEIDLYPKGWLTKEPKEWLPPKKYPPSVVEVGKKYSRTYQTEFQNWTVGVNGSCSIYTPPESYWCSTAISGGGASSFEIPTGVVYNEATFPNAPWADISDAVLHVFRPAHWALWMFEVGSYDAQTRTIKFGKGGFQGARGNKKGGEWYIENVFEELDYPNEYYYNTKTKELYFFYNGTGTPPSDTRFEATSLKTLVSIVGTQQNPVKNIAFTGIQFANSAYTYLDPHGIPSDGDWALQRMGAVFLQGTEKVSISSCLFDGLDGNALFLSGYTRNTTVYRNEFVWIGDSAMAAWGFTKGIDGTDGNQPHYTTIEENLVHEIGIWEKQSSAWFQGKSCLTTLKGNIFFNGPRAGINFNDGFGGGSEITETLLFNQCRESSDHGPFNSWDRQPFLTTVATGKPSLIPLYNEIHNNFFICNYGSSMCVDNDDGSSYYKIHNNFEVYGGHKSNFGGHSKSTYNSIQAFARAYQEGLCMRVRSNDLPGYVEGYWNNTCIQSTTTAPYTTIEYCNPKTKDTLPIMYNNRVYNKDANAKIECATKSYSLAEWQSMGFEQGTVVHDLPTNEQIIAWAAQLLSI